VESQAAQGTGDGNQGKGGRGRGEGGRRKGRNREDPERGGRSAAARRADGGLLISRDRGSWVAASTGPMTMRRHECNTGAHNGCRGAGRCDEPNGCCRQQFGAAPRRLCPTVSGTAAHSTDAASATAVTLAPLTRERMPCAHCSFDDGSHCAWLWTIGERREIRSLFFRPVEEKTQQKRTHKRSCGSGTKEEA
jgi:hypothetical protein